jgi:hypothetical protein
MLTSSRPLLVALLGTALLSIGGNAWGAGSLRGLRGYQAAVMIGPRAYPWPPAPPRVLRHYDLRGLDPLPLATSAYRQPYELSGPGASLGVYRPAVEAAPPTPAPPSMTTPPAPALPAPPPAPIVEPANGAPAPSLDRIEVVPAPPPAAASDTPRSSAREL